MELNSLPDLCLLHLFELFPVNIQAQLQAVCTRWKLLIEQRIWRKVRKIAIEYYPDVDKCHIIFDNSSEVVLSKVDSCLEQFITIEHFPGVNRLNLAFVPDKKSAINSIKLKSLVSHCLAQWTTTLTYLAFVPFHEKCHQFQSATWTQIDSMKSLKALYLHLPEKGGAWSVPDNFSILNNLEEFSLFDSEKDEIGALTQLGPNLRLLILHAYKPGNIQIIKSIAPKLISLRELSIPIPHFPQPYLLDLLTLLAQLTQLSDLHLYNVDWNQFFSLVTYLHDYPKLTSVKQLSMLLVKMPKPDYARQPMDDFNSHFFTSMPIMFPSLEDLRIGMWGQKDQEFVNMIKDRMKRKFIALKEAKFAVFSF